MKKLVILWFLLSVNFLSSQTLMPIGPQVSSFNGMIRGYHFTAPVNFTICGLRIPPDAPGAAGQAQEIRVVRFTAGAPPAFPGTTNSFVQLFSSSGAASGATVTCNIPVSAGDVIGVYGSVGSGCINSYDGVAFATNILGSPTTLLRSGMQSCPWGGAAMSNIWSEVGFDVGRIQLFYNCCPSPTVTSAASPTSICPGQSTNLTAGGAGVGGTYTWNPAGGAGSPVVVSPTVTTTYSVTGTTSLGCTGTSTVQVVVNPSPTITPVVSPAAICVGKSSTVTLSGASTYTTNAGNIVGSSVVLSPVATTIYTATGTSSLGCVNTKTFQVIVNPLPVVTPGSNSPICSGGTLNLTVGAANSYSWTGPLAFTSNLQNPSVSNVTAGNAGVYTASVTDASGCTGSGTVNVVVNPQPVISPTNGGPYCIGATINLSVAAYNTYTWTGPNGFTSNLQNPAIGSGQLIDAGVYTVSVTAVGGCMSTGTTNVIVNSLPTPTASSNSPVCVGQPVNFSGTGGTTYTWTGPGGYMSNTQNTVIASAQATDAGTYTLTVTNANGCTNFTTTSVVVNPLPVIVVTSPTVCVNQNINLSANGGATYAWSGPLGYSSNQQAPTIVSSNTTMSGGYTVVVTTASGCTASAVSNVSVYPLPSAAITSNTPCAGSTLSLTGSGGAAYSWSGPNGFSSVAQNPTIPNVSLAANGVYTLIATAGTCSNSATAPVLINALPVPTATNNSAVCVNQTINFAGTGGTTYTWTGPGGYTSTSQNPPIALAQATNAGTYTLTVTDVNGCMNFTTTNVVVNPLPIIVVTNPTVCGNQNINLSATGGATYAWSGPLGYTSILQNPVITNATTSMTGSYNVLVTTAAGCTASAVSNVSVIALPVPVITSNTPCVGSTLNLTGSGGSIYSWSGPNGFNSAAQNPTIPNVSLAANGVYSLTVTVGMCSNFTIAPVLINPLPTPNITSNGPVCLNQPATFTASGANSYSWSGPNGFTGTGNTVGIASSSNLNAGTYIVTATDLNNCSNTSSYQLVVNPLPVIAAAGSTVCANQNITLSATGGNVFVWNGPGGYTSNTQFPVIPNASLGMAGTYTVTVTDINGCTSASLTNVVVNSIPNPTISSNSPVCVNQTITLSSGAPTGVSYIWSGPNGFFANGQNQQIKPATPVNSGIYMVTVSDNIGCAASVSVNMIVNPLPDGNVVSTGTAGCIPLCITFTCQVPTPLQFCSWDFGYGANASGSVVNNCYTMDGAFKVTAYYTDINGCSNTSTYAVNPYPIPTADYNFAPQRPVEGEPVDFTNSSYGPGITGYSWYFSNLTDTVITEHNPSMVFQTPGGYAVALVVINDKGCSDTIVRAVMVEEDYGLYVPNAFTPNGDGLNDVFYPKGFGIVKYELNIFNRWGEKIFSTNKFEEGWAGNYAGRNDEPVQSDVYVWLIKFVNPKGKAIELTGKVLLSK